MKVSIVACFALAVMAAVCLPGGARAQTKQAAQPIHSFSDVPRDHWAYNAVNELHELGVIVGYPQQDGRSANQIDAKPAKGLPAGGLKRK